MGAGLEKHPAGAKAVPRQAGVLVGSLGHSRLCPPGPQLSQACQCPRERSFAPAFAPSLPRLQPSQGKSRSHGEERGHSPLGAMGPGSPCKEGDRVLTGTQSFCR